MFCCNCGQKIEGGTKFCPSCGTRVQMSAGNASPAQPEAYAHTEEVRPEAEIFAAGSCRADTAVHEEPTEPAPAFVYEPEAAPAPVAEPKPEITAMPETVPEPEQSRADGQAVPVGSPAGTDFGAARSDTTEVLSYAWQEEPSAPVEPLAEDIPASPAENAPAFAAPEQQYGAPDSVGVGHLTVPNEYTESREDAPAAAVTMPEPEQAQAAQPSAEGAQKKANDAPQTNVKKVKPIGRLGAGYGSLAVFLALLLFVSLTAAAVSTVAAVFLTEDGLKSIVDNIDIKAIKVKDGGESVTVSELIYDKYREFGEGRNWSNISEGVIETLLEDDVVSDLAAELLEDYRSYFLDGGSASGISAKRIVDYIDVHKAELQQALKNAGYEKDVDVLTDDISAALENIDIGSYSIESLEGDHSALMAAASFMLSKVFLIISWVLTAVWLILLICTTKRRVSAMFPFLGVPILILGILFCAASVAGALMPMFYDNGIIAALVNSLVYPILLTGAAAVLLGIILIIIGSSIKSHRKKAAAEAAEAAQAPQA